MQLYEGIASVKFLWVRRVCNAHVIIKIYKSFAKVFQKMEVFKMGVVIGPT